MNMKKIIVAILLSTLFLACMESKEVKLVKMEFYMDMKIKL